MTLISWESLVGITITSRGEVAESVFVGMSGIDVLPGLVEFVPLAVDGLRGDTTLFFYFGYRVSFGQV